MVEVRFTGPFQRRWKSLQKRYRQIKQDIQPIIDDLQNGKFIGNQIVGPKATVFKVRAKNSDIPTGKSGGYRLIYEVVSHDYCLLLLIYAKSDQADVSLEEIDKAIQEALSELD